MSWGLLSFRGQIWKLNNIFHIVIIPHDHYNPENQTHIELSHFINGHLQKNIRYLVWNTYISIFSYSGSSICYFVKIKKLDLQNKVIGISKNSTWQLFLYCPIKTFLNRLILSLLFQIAICLQSIWSVTQKFYIAKFQAFVSQDTIDFKTEWWNKSFNCDSSLIHYSQEFRLQF